jgi:DNA-binding LytR/AlgR family response regulator
MIRCAIIDDEKHAISVIENYIQYVPQLQLIGTTTNPLEGLEIVKSMQVDLIFLDIQMDEMSGIEFTKLLPVNVKVIFCTAFPEFAVETYNLEAIDYLLKPIPLPRFLKAAQRASNKLLNSSLKKLEDIPNDYIFIKADQKGKMIKLNFDELVLVEGMKNYVAFHQGKTKILCHLTLKEVEDGLPSTRFIRVHKSYIVSLKQIIAIENNQLILAGRNERIPISDTYKENFLERMKNNLLI